MTNERRYLLQIMCVAVGWGLAACGGVKSAYSSLEKQKYPQVQEKLARMVEKDSLPVGANYVYSLLYTDTAYQHYDIDTAYRYVRQAITQYPQLEDQRQEKLSRQITLDTTRLQQQKLRVDSLAYARATAQHQPDAYQRFIDDYETAPQLPQAIANRDQLAFDSIQQIDTYPAYKYFMDTYPEAEQYAQAQQRYNTLAFEELTQDGNLKSYLDFLKDYPRSPYRPQAEQAIYQISTADGQPESYAAFARQYPQSTSARRAVNILYHLYAARHAPANFLQDFPNLPYADSLRRAIRVATPTLAPVLVGQQYGFINTRGETMIDARYDYLPTAYLCEGVTTDFVHAATQPGDQRVHHVLTKAGDSIFSVTEPLDTTDRYLDRTVTDLGVGLLEVETADQYALWHQAGFPVIPAFEEVEEVVLIPSDDQARSTWSVPYQFIKFRQEGQWGIKAFSGRTLLEPTFDDIEEYGPFLVLERDGRLAVTNRQRVVAHADGSPIPLDFLYDDVALLTDDFLLAYQQNQETVLNDQLTTVVPLVDHSVVRQLGEDTQTRWLMKQSDSVQQIVNDTLVSRARTTYFLYPPTGLARDTTRFERAFYNDRWLALKDQAKFSLLKAAYPDSTWATYDSVQILSEHFVLAFSDTTRPDSATVLLGDSIRRTFAYQRGSDRTAFRLLRTTGIVSPDRLREYLLINPADGLPLIVDTRGETIYEQRLDGATVYPQGLIVVEQGRYRGLIDSLGQTLLPSRYEGIGNYQESGALSLLKNQKFGLYQYPSGTQIAPRYESALTLYSASDSAAQSLYVTKENGQYGMVTATDQLVAPFAFERMVYWNDTSALAKANGQWMIYRLALDEAPKQRAALDTDQVLYGGILDFSFLQEDQDEQLLQFYSGSAYGVLSSQRGSVLPPSFDIISLFGDTTQDDYLYFTEKYFAAADLHIIIYFDAAGQLIKRLTLSPEQYDRLYCDQ